MRPRVILKYLGCSSFRKSFGLSVALCFVLGTDSWVKWVVGYKKSVKVQGHDLRFAFAYERDSCH